MYEMRQKRIKELREKKWFNYALLAIAIFLFSQGSAIIKTNLESALPVILISFVLHVNSVSNLTERIIKIKSSIVANMVMLVILSGTSIVSYIKPLELLYIVLLNISAIALHFLTALACHKFKIGV
jgi:hypothetical protein